MTAANRKPAVPVRRPLPVLRATFAPIPAFHLIALVLRRLFLLSVPDQRRVIVQPPLRWPLVAQASPARCIVTRPMFTSAGPAACQRQLVPQAAFAGPIPTAAAGPAPVLLLKPAALEISARHAHAPTVP